MVGEIYFVLNIALNMGIPVKFIRLTVTVLWYHPFQHTKIMHYENSAIFKKLNQSGHLEMITYNFAASKNGRINSPEC